MRFAVLMCTLLVSSASAEKLGYEPAKDMDKLATLNSVFREKARAVIMILEDKKWPVRIVWAKRTKEENDALVKQKLAAPDSRHLYCEAVDVIYNHKTEQYSKDPKHPFYMDLEAAVERVGGLKWGGMFKDRWDPTHFELSPPGDGCPTQ